MFSKTVLGIIAAVALAGSADAATIIGLYNTGVDNAGVATTGNGVDPHWVLSGGTAYNGGSNGAFPLNGPWLAETATSRWLTPTANAADDVAATTYVYSTTFSLAGYVASTASFSGLFAADNNIIAIVLNGTTISPGASGFSAFTAFDSTGGTFLAGDNVLEFVTTNTDGPSGLRVEVAGDADLVGATVPEPSTWMLLITGFGLVGVARRRRPVVLTA